MKQLVLEISPPPAPDFSNFVAGQNAEAVELLASVADPSPGRDVKVIYLWGDQGSGKTHLLRAFVAASAGSASQHHGSQDIAEIQTPAGTHVVVDDVEKLDDAGQVLLFNAINARQLSQYETVLVTGAVAPRDLAVRPELSSRLGSGLVFALRPLTDTEKMAALKAHAATRGFLLREDVANYILRYAKRDMPSLIGILDALDKYSLETGREITVPLLRQMEQSSTVAGATN